MNTKLSKSASIISMLGFLALTIFDILFAISIFIFTPIFDDISIIQIFTITSIFLIVHLLGLIFNIACLVLTKNIDKLKKHKVFLIIVQVFSLLAIGASLYILITAKQSIVTIIYIIALLLILISLIMQFIFIAKLKNLNSESVAPKELANETKTEIIDKE